VRYLGYCQKKKVDTHMQSPLLDNKMEPMPREIHFTNAYVNSLDNKMEPMPNHHYIMANINHQLFLFSSLY
jgi:hypothetical protein